MTQDTMRAMRFNRTTRRLALACVPVPRPGPGEVLVRVAACGICGSDVHMIEGSFPPPSLEEVTPGHEAAGTVAEVGAGVPYWRPGHRVVIMAGRSCGACRHCISGNFTDCPNPVVMGQAYDGGWAEYVAVPSSLLVEVPDHIPLEQAALIADALATPFTGLIDRGRLRMGEFVGIWGIGGLGAHAVQVARVAGAGLIIAVDPNPAARRRALDLGADHALDPGGMDVRAEVMRLTGGDGLHLAAEVSGEPAALTEAETCLGRNGRLVVIGMCMEPVRLAEPSVLFGYYNHAVLGHDGYFKRDIESLVRLVGSGRLDLSRSVSHVVPLEDAARGVRQLAEKAGDPVRIVVKP